MNRYVVIVLIGAACFSTGRFMGPTKTEIKEVEKIVYQDRIVRDEVQQARIEKLEIRRVDGTVETKTVTNFESRTQSESETNLQREKINEVETTNRPDWGVSIFRSSQSFVGVVDRRIIGGLSIGVFGRTQGTWTGNEFGLGLRLEF